MDKNSKQKRDKKLTKREKQLLELATEKLAELFIMFLDFDKSKNENNHGK